MPSCSVTIHYKPTAEDSWLHRVVKSLPGILSDAFSSKDRPLRTSQINIESPIAVDPTWRGRVDYDLNIRIEADERSLHWNQTRLDQAVNQIDLGAPEGKKIRVRLVLARIAEATNEKRPG